MKIVTKDISFTSENAKLVGTLYYSTPLVKSPGVLFLHGAGNSSGARFELWQKYLCKRGYNSFIFDCRGVGKSEGKFEEGSLNNRLIDASNALEAFISTGIIDENQICVVGNSMSGHTAIRLVQKSSRIKALILAYAAAYSVEAEDKKFDSSFTQVIRKVDSWKNSPVFSILKNYQGKAQVVYGEKEDVIPIGVQEQYKKLVKKGGESITIKNAGHRMLLPKNKEEEIAMHELFEVSAAFLDRAFH